MGIRSYEFVVLNVVRPVEVEWCWLVLQEKHDYSAGWFNNRYPKVL